MIDFDEERAKLYRTILESLRRDAGGPSGERVKPKA